MHSIVRIQKNIKSINNEVPNPYFVDLLRSPGIDSQPGGTDSSDSIPRLNKNVYKYGLNVLNVYPTPIPQP
jgi:hypothetical protein